MKEGMNWIGEAQEEVTPRWGDPPVDASQGHRRISREERYLRMKGELLTHMSLLVLRRAELLMLFENKVDPNAEY